MSVYTWNVRARTYEMALDRPEQPSRIEFHQASSSISMWLGGAQKLKMHHLEGAVTEAVRPRQPLE